MVAAYHFCTGKDGRIRPPLDQLGVPYLGLDDYLFFGFIGVQVFFVISGYVIAASSVGRNARDFVIGRALRLLPLLWVATLIGLFILLAFGVSPNEAIGRAMRSATLYPKGPWIDVVVWTLVVEAVFYGAVWLLLIVARDQIAQHLIQFARALAVLSLGILVAAQFGRGPDIFWAQLFLLQHGGFFALGILIWAHGSGRRRFDAFALIALASCVLEIYAHTERYEAGHNWLIPAGVWTMAVLVVLYGATHLQPAVRRSVRLAGLMTYPIYLTHQTVGGAVVALAANVLGMPVPLALALAAATVLLVSAALVELVEPRLRPGFRRGMELVVPGRLRTAVPA